MAAQQTRLLRRDAVAEGTMAFLFERPDAFRHQAGQSFKVTLIDPAQTDQAGNSRPFTIASAPHERDLMIATRMRDTAFKRSLGSLPPGTPVIVDGPNGIMVLHEDALRPAVFLAGGIGVTPFLAVARDATYRRLPHRITLFYSNRRPEDAAFLDELQQMERANANFRLVATMTKAERSSRPWPGEKGVIRRDLLIRYLTDLKTPVYYFAGPPGMTMAMQAMLTETGVDEESMRSEEFYGY